MIGLLLIITLAFCHFAQDPTPVQQSRQEAGLEAWQVKEVKAAEVRPKLNEISKTGKLPPEWAHMTDADFRREVIAPLMYDGFIPENFWDRYRPAPKGREVPYSHGVEFTYDVTIHNVDALVEEIERDYGAKKQSVTPGGVSRTAWFSGMSEESAKGLSLHPKVRYVEQDQLLELKMMSGAKRGN